MRTFILAMVLNPEVQVKAQEEIDRVVGNNQLLDFDDRLNLPYVEVVYCETLRWRPVVPSGECVGPGMLGWFQLVLQRFRI